VDLWDLTKLLLRRWYFAVPMLLLSVALVVLTAYQVSPDYKAQGYMQMIPAPSIGKPVDPKAKPKPSNPWLDLGYAALGNASALSVTDQTNLERMAAEGFSDSVTVVLNERTPLFEIEVVGDSKEQATATVRQVIKLLQIDITAKQKQYGALPEDTISTLVINDGSSPQLESSKVKRVLIVAAGLGLILTTASTIALDYWLRRRSRRPGEPETDESAPEPSTPSGTAGSSAVRSRQSIPSSAEQTQVIRASPKSTAIRQSVRSNGNGYSPAERQPPAEGGRIYQPQAATPPEPAAGPESAEEAESGKTVVLPMSHASWRAPKKES
jgi:hypothetical protein